MVSQILQNIQSLHLDLENLPLPGGAYSSVNLRGNVAYVAIQFPVWQRQAKFTGTLGGDLSTEDGYAAARLCALNIIGQVEKNLGFERVEGLNHLDIYYCGAGPWDEAPLVADGASHLFNEVLLDRGHHTRSLVGVQCLPRNFSVGIVSSFTLSSNFS